MQELPKRPAGIVQNKKRGEESEGRFEDRRSVRDEQGEGVRERARTSLREDRRAGQ